jgi:hypothetical protein
MNDPKVIGIITDWKRHDGSEGYGGVGWYRIINPLTKLGHEWVGKISLGTPQLALDLKQKGDIWLWKPVDNEGMNVMIDTAKAFTNSTMVLDLDDEPFAIDPDHPLYDEIKMKSERVRRMIEISDHIIVSNPVIKESLKDFKKQVTVIPNTIDPEIWNVKKKERNDGKIRIGWVGSSSHIADIPVIEDALREILDKYENVEVYFCGFVAGDFGGEMESYKGRVFNLGGTVNYKDFPQFLADLGLDIAIAPLKDTLFNRSKTPIKWFESSMLEIPMVLSDVSPYKEVVTNYKNGYLAKNKSQWVKYLSWLIENPAKRREIGKEAKLSVIKNHTVDKVLPIYEKLFKKLTKKEITVYTALSGDFDHLRDPEEDYTANYVAFTDAQSEVWEVRKPYSRFKDDRRNSRVPKLLPHLYLDTVYSIYLDANIRLKVPAQKLIDEFLKDKDIAVFRHIGRDCLYDEAEANILLRKGDPIEISEQVRHYAERKHPKHAGMAECGVIIRRHTQEINDMNEKWWAHYTRFSERDQISFPMAFDLEKVNLIEGSAWRHPYFDFIGHKDEKNNVRHT